jgi:phospholipid/cholesterol/gamma-HCH transport system permease protein
MPIIKTFEWAGERLNQLFGDIGEFSSFMLATLRQAVTPPWRTRLIFDQSYLLGLKALPIAVLTAGFVGMVIVLQTGYQLEPFNVKQYAAGLAAKALTQEMIPIFTALVVGARTSASIAAELGTMRVTEQIDAMEVLHVDSRAYLVVPRVIAATLTLPLVTIYGDIIGLSGGLFMGVVGMDISARLYISKTLQFLTLPDVLTGIGKTFFFGAAMGLCGCYFGYNAKGGAEGVGRATTKAVVFTLTALVLLEFLLTSWTLYILTLLGVNRVGG